MPKLDPAREKRAANLRYAAKFPRRKKKERRKARKLRTIIRELRWLNEHRIERDSNVPLVAGQKREKGVYRP